MKIEEYNFKAQIIFPFYSFNETMGLNIKTQKLLPVEGLAKTSEVQQTVSGVGNGQQ